MNLTGTGAELGRERLLGLSLADRQYVRERVSPRYRDLHYLCLSDLRKVVAEFAEQVRGRVFDYGCGGAPYRELFGQCERYVGADVTPGPRVDRVLQENGLTDERSGEYQAVFSSQVLEHVKDPEGYLKECYRILEPGGWLFVSTHGFYLEHGCPYDFWRWTIAGLEQALRRAGFEVARSHKLTTEFRGILQMQHYFVERLRAPERRIARYFLGALRKSYGWVCLPVLNWAGDFFSRQGVVAGSDPAPLYLVICSWARKPKD